MLNDARAQVDEVYRTESRRVLATLIRLLLDFDLAEEALHEAFAAALERWPREGMPANPRAWLVSAGRFKAIDAIRRRARYDATLSEFAKEVDAAAEEPLEPTDHDIDDDRLRLIFTCCHPALSPEAQIAMTLREVIVDDKGQIVRPEHAPGITPSLPAAGPPALKPGQQRKEMEGVFLVKDARAQFQPVKTGIAGEKYFEVISGLKADDEVITGPFTSVRNLRDGDQVRVAAATPTPTAVVK